MNLGLHIDTTHVGWSMTDDDLSITKRKGQDLIGVVRFQEADTAEDRRLARSARNHRKRVLGMISFVNHSFEDLLNEADPLFLSRLKKSGLYEEDGGYNAGLFLSKDEAAEFYAKYPTIFHLKDAVISGKEKDIRFIYLTVLHCFKHRGHFNLGDIKPEQATDFDFTYNKFRQLLSATCNLNLTLQDKQVIRDLLLASGTVRERVSQGMDALSLGNNSVLKVILTLLFGGKGQMANVFPDLKTLQENSDMSKPANASVLCFDTEDFDLMIEPFTPYLSQDEYLFILAAKAMYDWSLLYKVLNGESSIRQAMMRRYDKHKEDLSLLKDIYYYMDSHGFKGAYHTMFRKKDENVNNYVCYVGGVVDESKLGRFGLHRSTESFLKELASQLSEMQGSLDKSNPYYEKISSCLIDIEADNFLPKQKDKRNASIPNVLVSDELAKILDVAISIYPALSEPGVSGIYSVKEELLMMCRFRIPYWMGPLNESKKFAWAVHKEEGVVYPWNLEDKIDFSKTRKNFIRSIVNECSLCLGETVLCENSYYINRMQVLDELNGIRIDGKKLPVEIKQAVFEDLSMHYSKVTLSSVKSLLYKHNIIQPGDEPDVSGFVKKKLNRSMGCYITAEACCEGLDLEVYEMLAEYVAIFKGDVNAILDALQDEPYDPAMLKKLLNVIKDSGWSIYSKKALTEIYSSVNGTDMNLLEALYNTDKRLSELLGSEFGFMDAFSKDNDRSYGKKNSRNMIDDAHTTPMVKRSLGQMMNVLYELKSFTKSAPDKVFLNIYAPNSFKAIRENVPKLLNKVFSQKVADKEKKAENKRFLEMLSQIKGPLSVRQTLWFLQRGKCLYTGVDIPYSSLFSSTPDFTIDHIYPKSKVYNNILTANLCLVSSKVNKAKDAAYPLDENIRKNMTPFWDSLLQEGLMTQAKYDALTSAFSIPLDIKVASVDKLLVEKRKTALLAEKLIHKVFPDSKVVFVSDTILNDFINNYDLQEVSVINYFPEARKSYYTQVVGMVWNGIFTANPKKYILENPNYSLNVWNYNSEFWNVKTSIGTVKEVIAGAHIKETYMKISDEKGAFSDSTIMSAAYARKKDGKGILPLSKEKADVTKYGGKTSIKTAYYSVARLNGELRIVGIPIYQAYRIKTVDDLIDYLRTLAEDVAVIIPRMNRYSVLNMDGFRAVFRSISNGTGGRCCCARTFIETNEEYCQNVFLFNRLNRKSEHMLSRFGITKDRNEEQYQNFLSNYENHYDNRPNNQIKALGLAFESFCNLDIMEQCYTLEQLYGLVRIDSTSADLSMLSYEVTDKKGNTTVKKLSLQTGIVNVSIKLDGFESVILEDISQTGPYRNKTIIK